MMQAAKRFAVGDAVLIGVYNRNRRGEVKKVSPTGVRVYVRYTLPSGLSGRWEPIERLTHIEATCAHCDAPPLYLDAAADRPGSLPVQVCRRHARPTADKLWH
jgi:hypothetical protein